MSGTRPPFPGWTLAEARAKCVDPELLECEVETYRTWRRAGCPGRFPLLGAPRAINPVSKAEGIRLDKDRIRAAHEATAAFRELLASGRLLAWGRRGSPVFDPIPLPSSAWGSLHLSDLEKSIAREPKETSVKIYDVKVYPAIKAPNVRELVSGLSFVEGFRRFILEDPEVSVLGRRAIKLDPAYARVFEEGGCYPHGIREWRVTCCDSVDTPSQDDREMIGSLNDPPPREVTFAEAALADRCAAFISLLRDGSLVARGIPQAPNLNEFVPRTVWSHRNYYFDARQGDVLETNPDCENPPHDMFLRRWSGLLLERDDLTPATEASVSKALLPQKRRRERYKGSAVRQAIEDAGIDLAITRLAPKAIASQIAAKLPFAISTPQADEALRKMVARQIKEARSAQ